ncbi:MAG: DUF3349 domain-containing protein [Actinobacteria bacterium]|nr:DUF3349 domain-containing protein [Actinomycetota bacterium]
MSFSFSRILGWLREGYPQGVPREDYIALFGVLQRHLTEEEIVRVGERIRAKNGDAPIDDDQIRRRIEEHLKGHASDDDVRRVAARLAAGGWPLAGEAAPAAPAEDAGGAADPGGMGEQAASQAAESAQSATAAPEPATPGA